MSHLRDGSRVQRRTEIPSSGSGPPLKTVRHTRHKPPFFFQVCWNDPQSLSYHPRHQSGVRTPFLLRAALPFLGNSDVVRREAPPPTRRSWLPRRAFTHTHTRTFPPTAHQASLCPQLPHVPWRPERRGGRFRRDVRLPRMMHPKFFPWMRAAPGVSRSCTNRVLSTGPNLSSALCPPRLC